MIFCHSNPIAAFGLSAWMLSERNTYSSTCLPSNGSPPSWHIRGFLSFISSKSSFTNSIHESTLLRQFLEVVLLRQKCEESLAVRVHQMQELFSSLEIQLATVIMTKIRGFFPVFFWKKSICAVLKIKEASLNCPVEPLWEKSCSPSIT